MVAKGKVSHPVIAPPLAGLAAALANPPRVTHRAAVPAPAPNKEPWLRAILTDHAGDWDVGAVLVVVVTIFMCCNSGYDTFALHNKFDAMSFGSGVAAMLAGFAAYKVSDRRPTPQTTATTTTTATSTTTGSATP